MSVEELRKRAGALYAAAQKAAELGHDTTSKAAHEGLARALQRISRAAALLGRAERELDQARQALASRGVRPEGPPWGNATLLRTHENVSAGRVLATEWTAAHWEVRGEAGGCARWVPISDLQLDVNAEEATDR